MSVSILQPIAVTHSPEEIQAVFQRVVHDLTGDSDWHFSFSLPRTVRATEDGAVAPGANTGLVPLARFEYAGPAAGLTISGERLARELDPADYLDFWLEDQGITAGSRKRLPMLGGAVGDVVGTWKADGVEFTGRFFCLKYGARLVLLSFRTHSADYPMLAESFFVTISSFRLLRDPPGPLAEKVQWIGEPTPVPWKLVLPAAWRTRMELAQSHVVSFQAELPWRYASGAERALGKLSYAVVAAGSVGSMGEAFDKALEAVGGAGLRPEAGVRVAEAVAAPFEAAAYLAAPMRMGEQSAEVRCRVLKHPKAWIIAAMVTPAREVAPPLWMHNKRVLDIATGTLEMG